MSKKEKLLNYLASGKTVTAKQIRGTFNIKNPHGAVYQLRREGNCVYANEATLADGTKTTKYRLGTPSKKMVRAASALLGAEAFTRS